MKPLQLQLLTIFALIVAVSFTLAACSSNSHSVAEVSNTDGIYCLTSSNKAIGGGAVDSIMSDYSLFTGEEPLIIDRSKGDQLIFTGKLANKIEKDLTGEDIIIFDGVVEKGYWGNNIVDITTVSTFEGEDVEDQLKKVEKDITVAATSKIFEPMGFAYHGLDYKKGFFSSDEKSEYTYGYYENTKYVEKTIKTDTPCYDDCPDSDYDLIQDVEKTKDSYYVIDIEKADPGLYFIKTSSGSPDAFIFEIK